MSDALDGLQKEIKMYDGRVFGKEVSKYGLESGYLDYRTLAEIVGDRILNNNIMEFVGYDDWDLVNGDDEQEVYQYYIISQQGYEILDYIAPSEIVYFNEELDMFLWGITHFGTSWDYVLTDLKLVEGWKL